MYFNEDKIQLIQLETNISKEEIYKVIEMYNDTKIPEIEALFTACKDCVIANDNIRALKYLYKLQNLFEEEIGKKSHRMINAVYKAANTLANVAQSLKRELKRKK